MIPRGAHGAKRGLSAVPRSNVLSRPVRWSTPRGTAICAAARKPKTYLSSIVVQLDEGSLDLSVGRCPDPLTAACVFSKSASSRQSRTGDESTPASARDG